MGSFFGLQVAMSGLRAHQQAMSIAAHNIANAGTEGYHRQEAVFTPGNPLTGSFAATGIGNPQLGTGVLVESVQRMQSQYIDNQVRTTTQWKGLWDYQYQALGQVESIIGEPGEFGLGSALDNFWNSWEELSAMPESLPARIDVVESGVALAHSIRNTYLSLRDMQHRTNDDIIDNVAQVNRLASDIAAINEQIRRSVAGGYQPNDLLDRRDLLLDELSQIVRIQISGTGGSELIVSVSGKALIQGTHVTEMTTAEGANGWTQLVWADDGSPVNITAGELAGQIQVRDELVENYIQSLHAIAGKVAERVNEIYSTAITPSGDPAGNFFVPGTDASNMAVEAGLAAVPSSVVTSGTGQPGDNSIALAISAARDEAIIDGATIGDAYANLVGRIGAHTREAKRHSEIYGFTLDQLKTRRESVSGVSLDEEMMNMVKFQQAYNAAARVATTIDEMIDTIISRMGTVGR